MSTTESREDGFARSVLQNIDVLLPSGVSGTDLACELGLSAWMRLTDTTLDDAPGQLWAVREAILEAAGMDAATEPIPMGARSPRLAVLNLVAYLGTLLDRAATRLGCDRRAVIAEALGQPVLHVRRADAPGLWERRSS
jgi:hypothetical protein